ncbi:MAG: hypothetical protein Fur0044_04710 [Anaerolineae bacterium]
MPQRPINRAKAGLTRRGSVALAFMLGRASQTKQFPNVFHIDKALATKYSKPRAKPER